MAQERKAIAAKVPSSSGNQPRVVVGVFSQTGRTDEPYRRVIRSTWMQQPLVCLLSELGANDSQCRFFVTFVLGNCSNCTGEADTTVLPIKENMNEGKTPAWFHYAARQYTRATHIVKMDQDAFPHLSHILSLLQNVSGPCPRVFGGRPWFRSVSWEQWRPWFHQLSCTPQGRGPPLFHYMHGGLYFMSRQLALELSEDGGWWRTSGNRGEPEDVVTSEAVQRQTKPALCLESLCFDSEEGFWHRWG